MIKWGCIQPLTGGMYIGALQATGCNAQWIIDYPGHKDIKVDKEGNEISAGNEANLLRWLKKNNLEVPVYTLNRKMFQQDNDVCPTFEQTETPDYTNMDLVVSVPVCSGLSNITIASSETKDERNGNMEWITRYTLKTIKPKVYVFENAPTLSSDKGESVRKILYNIADETGYSVNYIKTDTCLHSNPQKRPRTFVVFIKNDESGNKLLPKIEFVCDRISAEDYFNQIPDNVTQQTVLEMDELNKLLIRFCKHKYGKNWRDCIKGAYAIKQLTENKEIVDEIIRFIQSDSEMPEPAKTKCISFFNHAISKVLEGKNFYSATLTLYKDYTPSVQFKSLQCVLHHKEDRLFTVREAMWLMGLPHDFELIGEVKSNIARIGQNVPVGTAKYIVEQMINTINADKLEKSNGVKLFDNIKQKTSNL